MARKTIPASIVFHEQLSYPVRRPLDGEATVLGRGERHCRERPHRDVRARTFERSGTRSVEGRNRAYRGTAHCAVRPAGQQALDLRAKQERSSQVLAACRRRIRRTPDFLRFIAGRNTSISSVHAGLGWCLSLLLALALTGCETQNIRESGPDEIRTHADTAYQNEDWQAAEQDYLRLTRHAGADARDWYRLGNIYAHTNRPDDAIAAYREALKYDQGNSDAWNNLGLVQLRQATQTFIDMVNHTDVNDPLNLRARYAVTAITELLETRFRTSDAE